MPSGIDVIFVFPPAHGNPGVFGSHLGVAYLRASLLQTGISSDQYLSDAPGSIQSIAMEILSRNPRIVGFTAYDANFPNCLALARCIKGLAPDVKLILGGPAATFGAENILSRHKELDFAVLGETEENGTRIFKKLLGCQNPDYRNVPGLAFRTNGRILGTELPPLVGSDSKEPGNLDLLASPYLIGILANGRPGVLTGRGCTFHCQYCCFAALGRKRLRLHSIERVLAELDYIAAHQKRSGERYVVPIHDDTFTILPNRAKELCQAIAERGLGLMLSCITRADRVDAELLRLMREAGFVSLAYGLESAVPSVLRATGKVRPPDWPDPDLTPEREFVGQVRENVLTAKRLGFNVGVSIILGLPTETREEGKTTLEFVRHLPVDYYMHNYLWVFPGTPLWKTHDDFGIGCEINSLGLATTVDYAYDLTQLRPRAKCSLEQDAQLVRLLTADALYGCEAFQAPGQGVASVVVDAARLSEATATWLAEIVDVGGIVVQVYPALKRIERIIRLHEDRTRFAEQLVPARHYIQILPKRYHSDGNGRHERWTIACTGIDLFSTCKPELVSVESSADARPIVDWAARRRVQCDLYESISCLDSVQDLDALLGQAYGGRIEASLRKLPVPPRSKYPGRWLKGETPCLRLTRLEVGADESVRCCRQGPAIGRVGDSLDHLRRNISVIFEEVERRRRCDVCSNSHCPRCPFPGVEDDAYCDIMSKRQSSLTLMNALQLYSQLPLILEYQRDALGKG
jgi:radical SAM superfamily enzyme YgiQ (UPF0313 family)